MDTEIPVLLKDFAAALRTICGDPDLSVLLYNPPLENHDLLVSTTVRSTIPEFSSDEAAWSFVHGEFKGRPLACEPRQRVSADGHSILLEVPFAVLVSRAVSADDAQWERREFPSALSAGIPEGFLCIGASSLPPIQTVLRLWNLDGDEICQEDVLGDLTSLAARLFCRVFDLTRSLRDPVSQLPGRTEYESVLKSALVQAARDQQPLGVLLINPDDFVMVNHRYGREKGDGALREIARRLGSCMRNSDRLFRCGGAAFGLILPATSLEKVEIVAHKFQRALSDEAYLDGGLDLTFTVGGATVNPEDLPLESSTPPNLIRLAEHALHKAKLAGDAGVLLISIADASDDINHFHPDSGIFTADAEKDYRNMLLLWESVAMVSSIPDPVALAQAFVDLLHTRFWTDGVTLVRCGEDNTLEVIATRRRDQTDVSEHLIPDKELDTARLSLVRRASQTREMEQITEPSDGEDSARLTYALPLMAAEKNVGCLLIDGNETLLHLDATDLIFVNALSNQVALALDRFELVASQIQKTEREKRELRREVLELRHALHHSKLVYESKVMEDVMQTLRRIAPTDVTILIVGESGTGKELLARAVHEYSRRSETPLVTVDCGAITHSLFEAELFGYKKGAYTGAHAASEGRILQADGGT
ncbi:MAG: sigma 54-interacting transcriptional regulator, partial [Gammaproteobacteria bacterium]|nr:sigma 54-interacting transcriptional regulator [Gammaproteobacteria bacterium]